MSSWNLSQISAAPALPSLLPFYFYVCAFSIQRSRISGSLEQAKLDPSTTATLGTEERQESGCCKEVAVI